MRCLAKLWLVLAISCVASAATADSTSLTLHEVTSEGVGEPVGSVMFTDTDHGLLIQPNLSGVVPGLHGTHVHENPDCGPAVVNGTMAAARAAGGHHDPADTGRHEGPYGEGHLGDLPNILVEEDGEAAMPFLAPRVSVADLAGRSLVVHAGPDRFNDEEMGGPRLYCGVFE